MFLVSTMQKFISLCYERVLCFVLAGKFCHELNLLTGKAHLLKSDIAIGWPSLTFAVASHIFSLVLGSLRLAAAKCGNN